MTVFVSQRPVATVARVAGVNTDTTAKLIVVRKQSGDLRGHWKIKHTQTNIIFQPFSQIAKRAISDAQTIPLSGGNLFGDLFRRGSRYFIDRWIAFAKRHVAEFLKFQIILGQALQFDRALFQLWMFGKKAFPRCPKLRNEPFGHRLPAHEPRNTAPVKCSQLNQFVWRYASLTLFNRDERGS